MRRVMNLKGFLVILGLMLVVFLVVHPLLRGRYQERAERESELMAALTRLEDENRELTDQLSIVGTKDYIVSSAMENYSYMNRNDIRFEFSNPEALYAYTEEEIKILIDEIAD